MQCNVSWFTFYVFANLLVYFCSHITMIFMTILCFRLVFPQSQLEWPTLRLFPPNPARLVSSGLEKWQRALPEVSSIQGFCRLPMSGLLIVAWGVLSLNHLAQKSLIRIVRCSLSCFTCCILPRCPSLSCGESEPWNFTSLGVCYKSIRKFICQVCSIYVEKSLNNMQGFWI